jgi:hypothetical protein
LNYIHRKKYYYQKSGTPEGIRTPDPQLRRLLLYPTELLARMDSIWLYQKSKKTGSGAGI